jgi:putative ABC transport system substrate-binding protein
MLQFGLGWRGTAMQFDQMKRREFITLLGGTAATRPLAARAQQNKRPRRVGVLTTLAESDPEDQLVLGTFRSRLAELGWTEGF